jgi:hypothetical protein
MRKMKRASLSRPILFSLSAVFVMYGVYALMQSRENPQVTPVVFALVSIAGGGGLILNRRWSRYCIYVVSAALIVTWFHYAALALAAQRWRDDTMLFSIISFLPGLLIVFLAVASSYMVRKHFVSIEELKRG